MRNKFVYSYSVKICASGLDELLESIFCLLLVVEAFSLHKVVEMLEEMVVGWREVRWIWQMRQHSEAQFVQLLKQAFVVWCAFECCRGELGPFCWPMPAAGISVLSASHQFLSILFRSNGFTEIQKAVVDHSNSKPPSSDLWPFFGYKFGFDKCFGVSWSKHWAGHYWLSYKIHVLLHITIWSRTGSLLHRIREDDTSKQNIFFF